MNGLLDGGRRISGELSAAMSPTEESSMRMELGVAQVEIDALDADSDRLYELAYSGCATAPDVASGRGWVHVQSYEPHHLDQLMRDQFSHLIMRLNRAVPWSLTLLSWTAQVRIALGDLDVRRVGVRGGADDISFLLGHPQRSSLLRVSGGTMKIVLHLPLSTPAHVVVRGTDASVTADGVAVAHHWTNSGDRADGRLRDGYRVTVSAASSRVSVRTLPLLATG